MADLVEPVPRLEFNAIGTIETTVESSGEYVFQVISRSLLPHFNLFRRPCASNMLPW